MDDDDPYDPCCWLRTPPFTYYRKGQEGVMPWHWAVTADELCLCGEDFGRHESGHPHRLEKTRCPQFIARDQAVPDPMYVPVDDSYPPDRKEAWV